jgi:hypothetical protein
VRTLVASLAVLLCGGCVVFPRSHPFQTGPASARTVDASPDRVWEVLSEVYDELGLPAFEADASTYSFASMRAVNVWGPHLGPANNPYARCTVPTLYRTLGALSRPGVTANRVPVSLPSGRVVVKVETRLTGDPAGTRLETRVLLSPMRVWGSGGRDAPYCVSTGRLERQIANSVSRRVADPSANPA